MTAEHTERPAAEACHHHGETRIRWRKRESDGLLESVRFTPGFVCPLSGPKGHGWHGMDMTWALRGTKGATTFKISTGWIPGEKKNSVTHLFPRGTDIGYHSLLPFDHKEPERCRMDSCPVLDGQACYYDGPVADAGPLLELFLVWGEQIIWDELKQLYHEVLGRK